MGRQHARMTDTLTGVDRRTVRVAGTIAFAAVLVTALLLEPLLQGYGYGVVALAIYALALPALVVSIVEDVRRLLT